MNGVKIRKTTEAINALSAKNGRRKFIKTLAYGLGALVVGGFLAKSGGLFSLNKNKSADKQFSNFRFVERGNEVAIYDKSGKEILVVDKNAF